MTNVTHRLASAVSLPVAATVGALAAVRRDRAFHPAGAAFTGTWVAADDLLPPLRPSRPWPVVVRLSKGVGLPGSVPDILGLAVRLADLHGPEAHQDLLLASSGSGRFGRLVLRPTSDHGHARYTSLVPYDTPLGRGILWGRADDQGDAGEPHTPEEAGERALAGRLTYVVGITVGRRDHLLGEIRLHERLDAEQSEGLRFDPLNAGPGLRPTGLIQEARRLAYRASQRLRPTPGPDDTEAAVRQESAPGSG